MSSVTSRSSKISLAQESDNEKSIVGSLRRLSSPYSQSFYSLQSFASNKSKRGGKGWSVSKSVLMPNEVDDITKKFCFIHVEPAIQMDYNDYSFGSQFEDDDSTVDSEGAKSIDDDYVLSFMKMGQPHQDVLYCRANTPNDSETFIITTEPSLMPQSFKLPPVNTKIRSQQSVKTGTKGPIKKFENSPYASSSKARTRKNLSKNQ